MPPQEAPEERPEERRYLKEKVFLASQTAEADLSVLPSDRWALHYREEGTKRRATMAKLLEGKEDPQEAAKDLKPNAILYDAQDIEKLGLQAVSARIRDLSARIAYYDYARFAQFIASMQGREVDLDTLELLYDGIAENRIRKKLLDSYGPTGRRQMEEALRMDAIRTVEHFQNFSGIKRVLEALKMQWFKNGGHTAETEFENVHASLTESERTLFEQLQEPYERYVQEGSSDAYEKLVEATREALPTIQKVEEQMSPEMEKLQEELEPLMDQVELPGTPGDDAIPPEDNDEYHTPPPGRKKESKEQQEQKPIFEITPVGTNMAPLTGYYASGRKSYFDRARKTWSKRKQLSSYTEVLSGTKRWKMNGKIDDKLVSLPLPNEYALDSSSLKTKGGNVKLFRDQNGCFYVQADAPCFFSIEFQKENPYFTGPLVPQDREPLYDGQLSGETEAVLQNLQGNDFEKAQKIQAYVLKRHFYPGGGDLHAAQALQYKLRHESTPENYVSTLDQSEYLECYSSNTLFCALARRAGIPTRLVIGHRVKGARKGKATITQSTGHAWSEVWDGSSWRRIDATPPPKPQDQKKEQEKEKGDGGPTQEADDGGVEQPPGDLTQQTQERVEQQLDKVQQDLKSQEASTEETSNAQDDLREAREILEQMEKAKKELEKKLQEADSFEKLDRLEKEAQKEDLLPDMKEDLQKKIEAKEKQMKEELKDKIEKMSDDGFLDEKQHQALEQDIERGEGKKLDQLQQEIDRENQLYLEYDAIREEVQPLVDHWEKYFLEHLPKQEEITVDEDSVSRQGLFNRRAMSRPGNLLFGTVKNPRKIDSSLAPRFLAKIVLDVSGSMKDRGKLQNARKLLVFFNELFTRVRKEFGYLRFSISVFADGITEIKTFDQDYDAATPYPFPDGEQSTVKVRLMKKVQASGGTNMLPAIQRAAADLQEEKMHYPDYASALYFLGDGEDTCGNSANVRQFLESTDEEQGFGDHLRSAILLGTKTERQTLAQIFGDEHTTVAPDFEELVQQSMERFAEDIEDYLERLVA